MFSDKNRKCVRPQISLSRQLFFKNGFLHKIKLESHFNSSNGDIKASLTLSRSLKGVLIASILKKLTFRFHEFHEKSYSMAKNRPMCAGPRIALPLLSSWRELDFGSWKTSLHETHVSMTNVVY